MLWVAFCESWMDEGRDFKSYAGLCLFETGTLSVTVGLALFFTVQKKIPPPNSTTLVPRSSFVLWCS